MPRTRKELGPKHERLLLDLMARGGTIEQNTAGLRAAGADVSAATVGRRMRELAGDANASRAEKLRAAAGAVPKPKPTRKPPPAPPPPPSPAATGAAGPAIFSLPGSDGEIQDADTATLDAWIASVQRFGQVAETSGDVRALGELGRLLATLLEAKRKRKPMEKADPNDDPDMRALGAKVAARLHDYVSKLDRMLLLQGGER